MPSGTVNKQPAQKSYVKKYRNINSCSTDYSTVNNSIVNKEFLSGSGNLTIWY